MIERIAEAFNVTRTQAQMIITAATIFVLAVTRIISLRLIYRRIEDDTVWYRTRKLVSYSITIVGLVVLASIWLEGSGVATYVGLLSAGLAIALSDVLKNLAGWLLIVTRRPFRIGDRIEIAGRRGDVVDIRAFRFTLVEVENRIGAEQSTGRLMHIPNGLTFTEPLANFSEGFDYIWHEIPVLITFESNWERATEIIQAAVDEVSPDVDARDAMRALRDATKGYRIEFGRLTPTVYLTVRDSGVLLTGRVLVEPRKIRDVEQDVWKLVLRAFAADPQIELAYTTERRIQEIVEPKERFDR